MLEVSVCLFGIHSCSLSPGVPTLRIVPALLHAPVDTVGHPRLHTCAYRATPLFPYMHMSGSVHTCSLGAKQTSFPAVTYLLFLEGAYSTDTSSAHSSVPPMWLMRVITVSMAVASWGQSAFIPKQ